MFGSRSPLDSRTTDTTQVGPLALLEELSRIMDGPADSRAKLSAAMELLAGSLSMSRGALTLLAPGTQDIHIEIAYGMKPAEQSRGHYQPGEGVTGLVIQSGKPMVVPDVAREPRFLNRTRARNMRKDRIAFFCVPLKADDQAIGAISLESIRMSREQEADIVSLLSIAASMLAPHARRHQLHMQEDEKGDAAAGARSRASRPPAMIGTTPALHMVFAQIAQVAPSSTTVLIRGESGTGKELVAGAIHDSSTRAQKPFVSLNCAAIPETLIESELFGHERGAFTGATSARRGRFELANGGTLFLDEVGELSLVTQAKLLRVLQERTFERIGGMESHKVDVRILTATNRDLEKMVEEGTFRRDLYYRLNVFPITLPPLRERQNDILPLANHFMERFAVENSKEDVHLSLSVMDMLHRYAWPGNIRELENVMERAVLLVGRDGLILPQHLPAELHSHDCPACGNFGTFSGFDHLGEYPPAYNLQDRLDELERAGIINALETTHGHMGRAAAQLGLTERIMALRMKKYGLRYQDYRNRD